MRLARCDKLAVEVDSLALSAEFQQREDGPVVTPS